jgi:hypothetical protein
MSWILNCNSRDRTYLTYSVTLKDSAIEDALQKRKRYHSFSIMPRIEGKWLNDFAEFKEVISEISEEFHTRLNDFDSLKPKLQLLKITRWILKWPSKLSIFNWSCVIFSRILFLNRINESPEDVLENAISREVLQASKFLSWNVIIVWKHLYLWSCIFHYEHSKIKDEKSPW